MTPALQALVDARRAKLEEIAHASMEGVQLAEDWRAAMARAEQARLRLVQHAERAADLTAQYHALEHLSI